MPAEQQGTVYKTKKGWGIRYCNEGGVRRRRSGFQSQTEARKWFRDVERPRIQERAVAPPDITLDDHVADYLEAHAVGREDSTIQRLSERLRYAQASFGDVRLRDLEHRVAEIAQWRTTLPEGSQYGVTQALRQTLGTAVQWGRMDVNPAKLAGSNPQPKQTEIMPFTFEELDALAVELGPLGPMIRFGAATGLRPSELLALEWNDIDRRGKVVRVERTVPKGVLKRYGKTARSRRRTPLSSRALHSLDATTHRLNSALVFPAPGGGHYVKAGHGGYLDLKNFRTRDWNPALDSAGLQHRTPYALRHTYATWALAAGISTFELARYMGTSLAMIERTYGHLAPGSEALAGAKLDALESVEQDRSGQDLATDADDQ